MVVIRWSEVGYPRPQVVGVVLGAVVSEPSGAVVAGDKVPGVEVVVEPPPLLLLQAVPMRTIPASMAAAVVRRMWGMTNPFIGE
jgi:hypothetical protein